MTNFFFKLNKIILTLIKIRRKSRENFNRKQKRPFYLTNDFFSQKEYLKKALEIFISVKICMDIAMTNWIRRRAGRPIIGHQVSQVS